MLPEAPMLMLVVPNVMVPVLLVNWIPSPPASVMLVAPNVIVAALLLNWIPSPVVLLTVVVPDLEGAVDLVEYHAVVAAIGSDRG